MQAQAMKANISNKAEKPSLLKMVWNPIEQLQMIKQNPVIMFALFTVTLLYTVGAATMALNYDINSIVEDVPDVDNNTILFKSIVIGSAAISGLTTPLFNILMTSVVFYVVAKFIKSPVTFRQLFSMNTYVMMIGVIGLLFNSLLLHLFNMEGIKTVTGLSSFVDHPALTKIEVFSIWQTILTGYGLYYVGRFPKVLSVIISSLLFIAIIVSGFLFSNLN